MAGHKPRLYTRLQTVTHPSTNRTQYRVTSLIETNVLPLSQADEINAVCVSVIWPSFVRSLRDRPVRFSSMIFKVAYVTCIITLQGPLKSEGLNRDVRSDYQDMLHESGISSVNAERLAVTVLLQCLRATRSTSAIDKPEMSSHQLRNA